MHILHCFDDAQSAVVVNCARGPVVDEAELIGALEAGAICHWPMLSCCLAVLLSSCLAILLLYNRTCNRIVSPGTGNAV